MLVAIYNSCTKKSDIIKKYIEDQKDSFLERVYQLDNPFYLAFYEQSIESIVADAYEFFVELDCEHNYFYDNLWKLTKKKGRRFYRLMSMYHTIKTLRKKKELLDNQEMKQVLFHIFSFDEREKKLYDLLYSCACNYEGQFQGLFNKSIGKYLFYDDISNPFILAFLQNFCYNSYINFIQSFTKYISFSRRLKKAAN